MVASAFYLIVIGLFVCGLIWFLIAAVRDERWGCAAFLAIVLIGIFLAGKWLYAFFRENRVASMNYSERLRQAQQQAVREAVEEEEEDEEDPAELAQLLRETISVRSQTSLINIAIFLGFVLITGALASLGSFESRTTGIAVSLVLLLAAAGLSLWAFKEGRPLFVADARGIEERRVWLGKTVTRKRVEWSQVKAATYAETRTREDPRTMGRNTPLVSRVSGRHLRLMDSAGNELMYVPRPWGSEQDQSFEKLLRAIPGWAGCKVGEGIH